MTQWRPIKFDIRVAREDVASLEKFLQDHTYASENQLRDFFDGRPQLVASLGLFNGSADGIDCWAPQLDLGGRHRCDYVAGHRGRTAYTLVEMEDALESSVFTDAPATPYFTDRFNHGFSQIIDWLCQVDGEQSTGAFRDYWGNGPSPYFVGLLLVGRRRDETHFDDARRLEWRNAKVRVNSHTVLCFTYDDLVERLRDRLDVFIGLSPTEPK